MDNDQWKIINERLNHIQNTVDNTNKDLSTDREDLQNFALRLGGLEEQMNQVWKIVNNLPDRVKGLVTRELKPMQKETRDLKDAISQKRFVKVSGTKKRFWFF